MQVERVTIASSFPTDDPLRHHLELVLPAAQQDGTHPGPVGAFFRRLSKRKNRSVAVVATARKLVVIAWHMLRNNEPYRYA